MEYQAKHSSPDRVFRAAVLNGVPIPEQTRAVLEARGVNTDELEARIRQQIEWRH
jgi:hypothetical protein